MEMARCDDQDFCDVCDAKFRLLPAYRQVSEPGGSVTLGRGTISVFGAVLLPPGAQALRGAT